MICALCMQDSFNGCSVFEHLAGVAAKRHRQTLVCAIVPIVFLPAVGAGYDPCWIYVVGFTEHMGDLPANLVVHVLFSPVVVLY